MLKAATHGVVNVQGCCAYYYAEGLVGFAKDAAAARRWAEAAAAQGNVTGELIMAELAIDTGDSARAAPWLEFAAQHGSPRAQMLLGLTLFSGIRLSVDVVVGVQWLRKAEVAPDFHWTNSRPRCCR